MNSKTLLYVSGNSINAIDLSNLNEPEAITAKEDTDEMTIKIIGECPAESHSKVIICDRQISAYAVYPKENVIAYSEKNSSSIKLIKWSPLSGVVSSVGQLEAKGDIGLQCIAFSHDGNLVAALGSIPSFQISLWEWRSQKHICASPNGSPAKFISFNPLDSKQLCTSGMDRVIRFWKVKVGFKRYSLVPTMGNRDKVLHNSEDMILFPEEYESHLASPFGHMWSSAKTVYSTNELGSEIYKYHADKGTMEVFLSAAILSSNSNEQNLQHALPCAKHILVGGKDGRLRWFSTNGNLVRTIRISTNDPIIGLHPSPNYKQIAIHLASDRFVIFNPSKQDGISIKVPNGKDMVFVGMFPLDKIMVSAHSDGTIQFWNSENARLLRSIKIPARISHASVSPISMSMAVGSTNGYVRIYSVPNILYQAPKLIFKTRAHPSRIVRMEYEGNGKFLASAADDGSIYLFQTLESIQPLGFVAVPGSLKSIQWEKNEEDVTTTTHAKLFSLASLDSPTSGISVFHFSLQEPLKISADHRIELQDNEKQFFKVEQLCVDFFVAPKHLNAGKYIFYTSSNDKTTRVYALSSASDTTTLTSPSLELVEHRLGEFKFASSSNGEWLITMGLDGLITMRSLIESERVLRIQAHSFANGAVTASCLTLDSKHLYTAANDSLLKRWDWKLTPSGRKAAAEAIENAERLESEQRQFIEDLTQKINGSSAVEDDSDSVDETPLATTYLPEITTQSAHTNEKNAFKNQLTAKFNAITEKILKLIAKNEQAPELEKISRQEFVVDLKEKARLLEETDKELALIKQAQEEENLKQRQLKQKIKEECWDSMNVIGQAVKSFKVDPVLGKQLEVYNYPIRKRPASETERINKLKRVRKIQKGVARIFKAADSNTQPLSENEMLLYDPLELTTKERRRIQAVLLGECIMDIQTKFNQKFEQMVRAKQDEIAKIDEKNERVSAIISQLQLQEQVFRPELDDDEVPERIIDVKDSEIKVERFLTEEERKKLEAKRLAQEERLRLNGEDNSRQRALMQMMGGKLEDRRIQEEKEEIVRPEWMNKPKEEMTDDERKQLKEFEKKMAIFKEEQEKQKKALETELRKIQASISEIQDAYDQRLHDFANQKMLVDTEIFKSEVLIVKQTQYAIECIHDDSQEVALNAQIENLKQEKINYTNEIPEIKKELEKCREDYDNALKRDKEIEKQFKKEFHVHEFYFDTLSKLFKKRNDVSDEEEHIDGDLNPFIMNEKDQLNIELNPAPLNQATELPDGLPVEVWNKLVEIRDKKIASEMEVYQTSRLFKEMHALVQNILEESDNIKNATQKAMDDLTGFVDHKFRNTYNIEMLMGFKQGQVEVPQAPIVTNYSDAVLLHRSVVETLNDQVRHLGKLKVDALTEMKEYRKGIHALEWENKMHDFQADDLIIRSRDIQLLRVTKEMQEFLRSGDIHKQATEISNLEKISEHSQRSHVHHIEELKATANKIKLKKQKKEKENVALAKTIDALEQAVQQRQGIQDLKNQHPGKTTRDAHRELFTRRRLVDLAKSQAQDIAILREELERLRLKTYPAFRA